MRDYGGKVLPPYQVVWSERDKEYVGLCSDFPSLSWLDETEEAALQGIKDCVEEYDNER